MVSAKVPITLFRPGAGGLPPYLAGRDRELAKMKPLRESLRDEKECPVLLMLAGTPGLRTRLGAMNATFWDRLNALLRCSLAPTVGSMKTLFCPR